MKFIIYAILMQRARAENLNCIAISILSPDTEH